MPANDDNQVLSLSGARKGNDMVGVFAQYFEWNISAALEKIGELPAEAEKALGQRLFNPPVVPIAREIAEEDGRRVQLLGPCLKIHRAAIVGVDQREIPSFGALIEIGHARKK